MSKLKVGDKVRILDGSKIENYTGIWINETMKNHIGEVHTIKSVDSDWTNGRVSYKLNDFVAPFIWDERGLELVNKQKQSEQKIVITTHGRIVKARLYKDEKLVRQSVARCAPDDKFDFNVGANLAFTRLMGTSPNVTSLDWDKFAHGKLAVKVNKKTFDAFMKQCEQRNFTWHNGQKINVWKLYDEMLSLAKGIVELAIVAPSEYIYISATDGELKWCEKRDKGLDEYEFI